MNIQHNAGIAVGGRFSMEVVRHGKVRAVVPLQDNLILDRAIDYLLEGYNATAALNTRCFVGTGNTPPDKSQTGMQGAWWWTTNTYQATSYTNPTGPELISSRTTYYAFALGAVVGNIAEVGVSAVASASGQTHTRALIKDSLGNPIVLTLTAEDQLYVAYTIYNKYVPIPVVSGSFNVIDPVTSNTVNIPYEIHPCGRTSSSNSTSHVGTSWVTAGGAYAEESNAIPMLSTIQTTSSTGVTVRPYVAGSRQRTFDCRWTPTQNNFPTGIGRIFINPLSSTSPLAPFCIVFPTTKLPKNADCRLVFSFTISFGTV